MVTLDPPLIVGNGLTLNVAVLLLLSVLLHKAAFAIAAIVIVVEPLAVRLPAGMVKVPLLPLVVNVAVSPVAKFGALRL